MKYHNLELVCSAGVLFLSDCVAGQYTLNEDLREALYVCSPEYPHALLPYAHPN